MPLDECYLCGPAAQRLQTQCPRSGKQVDSVTPRDVRPQQIENRLANAVFHRPRALVAAVLQLAVAERAADYPQPDDLPPGSVISGSVSRRISAFHSCSVDDTSSRREPPWGGPA